MLAWSTAIVPLLLIARGVDLLVLTKLQLNEIFPAVLLSVSLATITLVAIWVVLGAGHWYLRLPFMLLAPLLLPFVLEWCSSSMLIKYGASPRFRIAVVELYIEMAGSWFAWIWQGTALLAALYCFLRASGYRFVRNVQTPAPLV